MLLAGLVGTRTPYNSPGKAAQAAEHEVRDANGKVLFTILKYNAHHEANVHEPVFVVRRVGNMTAVITDMNGTWYSTLMRIEDACAVLAELDKTRRAP